MSYEYGLKALEKWGGEDRASAQLLSILACIYLKLGNEVRAHFYQSKAQEKMDERGW